MIAAIGLGLALVACAPSAPPATDAKEKAAEAAPGIAAPAGEYKIDPNHASLVFRVPHMGLSNYTLRFAKLDATVTLDPTNIAASSVSGTVDPLSIRSDYPGDYRATHGPRGRNYRSWDEDLGTSPEFLNGRQFPTITFRSTAIEPTGGDTARITGDLTLLGQTHPVTMDAKLTGSMASHPFGGGGAFGVSATGTFNRSQFGMTHLIEAGAAGDPVTFEFNGEFRQVQPPAPPAAK
jgi:polyisoprenoid-binding protein YceI